MDCLSDSPRAINFISIQPSLKRCFYLPDQIRHHKTCERNEFIDLLKIPITETFRIRNKAVRPKPLDQLRVSKTVLSEAFIVLFLPARPTNVLWEKGWGNPFDFWLSLALRASNPFGFLRLFMGLYGSVFLPRRNWNNMQGIHGRVLFRMLTKLVGWFEAVRLDKHLL